MFGRVALLCVLACAAGCGTVVRGTKQGVKFQSEPPGAYVTIERAKKEKTRWNCTAPCELQLSRKRDFNVTFELDGYKPATARLASRIGAKGGATAIAGNFVVGGPIGFVVDAGTGANMQLKPDPMRAKLARVESDEPSIVYDVRIEGGGRDREYESPGQAPEADAPTGQSESALKKLPIGFGADVVPADAAAGGLVVKQVIFESAAARAGLKTGDVIKKIGAVPVSSKAELEAALGNVTSGESVMMTILRDAESYEAKVTF